MTPGPLGNQEDPPETEAEYLRFLQLKMQEIQQRHLLPLKEDVTDWLNTTLGCEDITVENYMHSLDTGIRLCRLARIIVSRAAQMPPEEGKEPICFAFKCWDKATSGTFFARDNVFNFLQFCRRIGCRENFLFETDGLVLHSQPRDVLLCLLELGRRTCQYVEPPCLVQFEQEIDQQLLMATAGRDGSSDSGYSDTHERQLTPPVADSAIRRSPILIDSPHRRPSSSLIPVNTRRLSLNKSVSVPGSVLASPSHHRSAFNLHFSPAVPSSARRMTTCSTPTGLRTPSRIPRLSQPRSGISTPLTAPGPLSRTRSALASDNLDGLSRRLRNIQVSSSYAARQRNISGISNTVSVRKRPASRQNSHLMRNYSRESLTSTNSPKTTTHRGVSTLDEKVRQTVAETVSCCVCVDQDTCQHIKLERLSEGQYVVAGKIVFIRLLKGKHVMVRVGGGWDTLEHFLTRHESCHTASTLTTPITRKQNDSTLAMSTARKRSEATLATPIFNRSICRNDDASNSSVFLRIPARLRVSRAISMDVD